MTTSERMKILNMIAEGQVTPEDGARLLEAINGGDEAPTPRDQDSVTMSDLSMEETSPVPSPASNGKKQPVSEFGSPAKMGAGKKSISTSPSA